MLKYYFLNTVYNIKNKPIESNLYINICIAFIHFNNGGSNLLSIFLKQYELPYDTKTLRLNYKDVFLIYYNLFKKNINLEAIQRRFQILSLLETFLVTYFIKKTNFQCVFLGNNYYKKLNKLNLKKRLLFNFKKRIRRFYLFRKYKINKKKMFYVFYSMFIFKDITIFRT